MAGMSALNDYGCQLFELMQIVCSSVLDKHDISRAEHLAKQLLSQTPHIFVDFGNKPKFHYGLGHIALMLERHGPTPFWSSFAFESRLGDLKRACLLVANNKGVAQRGGDLAMEMFSLRNRRTEFCGCSLPLIDWACNKATEFATVIPSTLATEDAFRGLELHSPVADVRRFEGFLSAFTVGAYIGLPVVEGPPYLAGCAIFHVRSMCLIQGISLSRAS